MQLLPTVCTPNTEKNHKTMEKDQFDGKINVKDLVLDLLKLSTMLLLNMTGNTQKENVFSQKAVKINAMAIARDVFVIEEHTKCYKTSQWF